MGAMFQPNLPALPLERLEGQGETDLQNLDRDLSLDEGKQLFGDAMWQAMRVTRRGLKDFGDPAQVGRYCKGIEVPAIIGRLFQAADVREELVVALAERAGLQVQRVIAVPGRPRRRA